MCKKSNSLGCVLARVSCEYLAGDGKLGFGVLEIGLRYGERVCGLRGCKRPVVVGGDVVVDGGRGW